MESLLDTTGWLISAGMISVGTVIALGNARLMLPLPSWLSRWRTSGSPVPLFGGAVATIALVGLALMRAGDRMAWRRGVFHGAIMDGCEHDAWSRSTPSMLKKSSFFIGQYGR